MPDKEFDKLFKDKFSDAEVEPSLDLWANIENQVKPSKKRILPIFWMVAATVAIVVTAMLLIDKKEVIQLQGQQQTAIVVKPTFGGNTVNVQEKLKVESSDQFKPIHEKVKPLVVLVKESVKKEVEDNSKNILLAVQPDLESNRLPIKQQEATVLVVLPKKETLIENPIVIASSQVENEIEDNVIYESGIERKGIRNVGDLVNFVVEKVDKREKKLLRFNTDDDDNSSLIGINIGFLKLNSKKHK